MQEMWVRPLGQEDSLEKGMAAQSSALAWRIPWTEEPGRLQTVGLQSQTRLSDYTHTHTYMSTHTHTHARGHTCTQLSQRTQIKVLLLEGSCNTGNYRQRELGV